MRVGNGQENPPVSLDAGGPWFLGLWRAEQKDANGNVVSDTGWVPNKCNVNLATAVMEWMTGTNNTGYNPVPWPDHTELGTGTGTPSSTDTDLFAPVAATLQKCSVVGPVSGSPQIGQWITQYMGTTGNAGNYSEAGLKDPNGKLWAHLAGVSIQITQGLTTTLTVQITAAV